MVPRVAVIDPAMTIGLPRSITASSGLDAIVQLVEAFTTPTATPYSDLFALAGAQRALAAFPIVLDDPADVAARASMSLAATLSGLALANAKLGAVHGLAAALGGLLPAPHGIVCGIMAAPIFTLTVNRLRQSDPDCEPLHRYQQLAAMATGTPTARAEGFPIWIAALVRSAGLPRLRDLGVTTDLIPQIAESAVRSSSTKGHPTVLTARDFQGLLTLAR
jgi:alcohol dehydrogenase class IV